MPTDGTLLLEHMPKQKQYLVTALSVFFSFGAVLSAVVALLVIPQNSCPAPPLPCNVDVQNKGWEYLLTSLGLIVCALALSNISLDPQAPVFSPYRGLLSPSGKHLRSLCRQSPCSWPASCFSVSTSRHGFLCTPDVHMMLSNPFK